MRPDQPSTPGERASSPLRTIGRITRYAAGSRGPLYILLLVTLISIGLDIVQPLLIESCIRYSGLERHILADPRAFFVSFVLLLADVACSAVTGYFHGVLTANLTLKVSARFRTDLFARIMRLPMAQVGQWMPGDMMSRIVNDADLAAKAFSESLLSLFSSVIVIGGTAVIMIVRSPLLALISIGASLVSVFVVGFLSNILLPRLMSRQRALGAMNAHFEETFRGFRGCVIAGRTRENNRLTRQHCEEYYREHIHAAVLESVMEPLMMFFGNINFVAVLVFGAWQALRGIIDSGTLVVFVTLSRMFMEPVSELGGCFAQVQSALAGAERVFEILDAKTEEELARALGADSAAALPAGASCGEGRVLRLENVTFGYGRRPVLRDFGLDISRTERIAVVGQSGAGKTTLSRLLTRLYEPDAGAMWLSGVDYRTIPLDMLRRKIGIVEQEAQIVDGTIYENIAYGTPEATEADVVRVSEAVGLDRMLRHIPNYYETYLESMNPCLSQGQLQLICLARILLRDVEVLILDESTSSMDAVTEKAIKDATAALMEGRACIFIAHRLASVTDMDRICVLSGGKIVESGTHEELMAEKGAYYEAYARQFAGGVSLEPV